MATQKTCNNLVKGDIVLIGCASFEVVSHKVDCFTSAVTMEVKSLFDSRHLQANWNGADLVQVV